MPRPPLATQLRPGDWVAIDGVLAVLLAVVFVVGTTRPAHGIPLRVAYLLALASTLSAGARRYSPLPVLGVALAGPVAAMATGTGKDRRWRSHSCSTWPGCGIRGARRLPSWRVYRRWRRQRRRAGRR